MPNIHLIGIGGAGLSAIATVLLQQGYTVSGSDMQASLATARLEKMGATVFIGHRAENLASNLDTVIISSAIGADNPELLEARQRGLTIAKRADWLGHMMLNQTGIAIAGTHGKSTTTAMTAFMLQAAALEPTYIVGAFIPQLNTNAAAGQGSIFVIEADEYDHMFLGLHPQIAVITIVEWDHPDIFPSFKDTQQAFIDFVQLVPAEGLLIACGDAPGVQSVVQHSLAPVITYGLQDTNTWQAIGLQPNSQGGYDFQLRSPDQTSIPVSLKVPGQHNVQNALAALLIARHQDLDLRLAAEILGRFEGICRRFELKGEVNGITVIDDYAHHPTEIRATLSAARTRFGKRPIWVVFQPHTFSRILSLFDDFVQAFVDADHVIVVDIFASREQDQGFVSSQDIVKRMTHPDVSYIALLTDAVDYLATELTPAAVLLTLGAGDGYQVGEQLLEQLKQR